jgi:hypothetical protein
VSTARVPFAVAFTSVDSVSVGISCQSEWSLKTSIFNIEIHIGRRRSGRSGG